MKKVFFILIFAFVGLFASASNTKATQSIDLQSNMTIAKENVSAKKGWRYLGIYDVYVDGVYQGTYHVWVYESENVA
jgi:ribosomal protein L9